MVHVLGSGRERLQEVGRAMQAHPELLGAAGGPAPGGLVLRLETATTEQHPAGLAASRTGEPAPAAAEPSVRFPKANFQKMYDEGIQIALKYFGE
jgi:hypothetical protein